MLQNMQGQVEREQAHDEVCGASDLSRKCHMAFVCKWLVWLAAACHPARLIRNVPIRRAESRHQSQAALCRPGRFRARAFYFESRPSPSFHRTGRLVVSSRRIGATRDRRPRAGERARTCSPAVRYGPVSSLSCSRQSEAAAATAAYQRSPSCSLNLSSSLLDTN